MKLFGMSSQLINLIYVFYLCFGFIWHFTGWISGITTCNYFPFHVLFPYLQYFLMLSCCFLSHARTQHKVIYIQKKKSLRFNLLRSYFSSYFLFKTITFGQLCNIINKLNGKTNWMEKENGSKFTRNCYKYIN